MSTDFCDQKSHNCNKFSLQYLYRCYTGFVQVKFIWKTCLESHETVRQVWIEIIIIIIIGPRNSWTQNFFLCSMLMTCWSRYFSFLHRALNLLSSFIYHTHDDFYADPSSTQNTFYTMIKHTLYVPQLVTNPSKLSGQSIWPVKVRKVVGSIPVGDSDFFFVLCLWNVDHLISRGKL